MLVAMACLVASLGVLAGSNGQAVERWSALPSTTLAALTAIANLSVRYAAVQGVLIAWWMRALRGMAGHLPQFLPLPISGLRAN